MLWVTSHRALDDSILQGVGNTSSPFLGTGVWHCLAFYSACTASQDPLDRSCCAPGGGACLSGPAALFLAAHVLPHLCLVKADGAHVVAPRLQHLVPAGRQARPRASLARDHQVVPLEPPDHLARMVKDLFGIRKVRCRGLGAGATAQRPSAQGRSSSRVRPRAETE